MPPCQASPSPQPAGSARRPESGTSPPDPPRSSPQAGCSGSPVVARQSLPSRRMRAFAERGRKVDLAIWLPPHRTSAPSSSSPAATATSSRQAPPVRANRRGVLPELLAQIPEGEQIGTVTTDSAYDTRRCHAPSSSARQSRSYRSARMADRGRKAARRDRPETKPSAPPATLAGRSGSAGPDTMPEAGSRYEPGQKKAKGNRKQSGGLVSPERGSFSRRSDALPQVVRRAHRRARPRPPDRQNPHPHRIDQPLLCPRHRRDRSPDLAPAGKAQVTPHPAVLQQRHDQSKADHVQKHGDQNKGHGVTQRHLGCGDCHEFHDQTPIRPPQTVRQPDLLTLCQILPPEAPPRQSQPPGPARQFF